MTSNYGYSNKLVVQPLVEPGQYTAVKFTERLALEGIAPSISTVGDALDSALMET